MRPKRLKCNDESLLIRSNMTVLFQGFSSPRSAKEGNTSLVEIIWQQRRHQLWILVSVFIITIVVFNTCFMYSSHSPFPSTLILNLDPDARDSNSNSSTLVLQGANPAPQNQVAVEPPSQAVELQLQTVKPPARGACDLSQGRWVRDPAPPLYTNETCKYIQVLQNCMRNGKPAKTGYFRWRWKPQGCELPRFDPALFLRLLKTKKLLFFGDSLARNHMQSLLCSLSQVEDPQKIYSREDKDVKWFFPSYNFTLAIVWSPFLVKHVKVRDEPLLFNLHLDVPHPAWSSALPEYDLAIFSASQWFFRPSVYSRNNTIIGCNEYSRQNYTDIYFMSAFQSAMKTTLNSIANLPGYTGTTFLRTASPEHFEHGTWSTGGVCNRTSPYLNQSKELPWLPKNLNMIQLEEYQKFIDESSRNREIRSKLKVLDVTYSAFLRPDGHPGPYRSFVSDEERRNHLQNDCLHWCLPGPVDMWNELLLEAIKEQT